MRMWVKVYGTDRATMAEVLRKLGFENVDCDDALDADDRYCEIERWAMGGVEEARKQVVIYYPIGNGW